jgi:hypothetical protein
LIDDLPREGRDELHGRDWVAQAVRDDGEDALAGGGAPAGDSPCVKMPQPVTAAHCRKWD